MSHAHGFSPRRISMLATLCVVALAGCRSGSSKQTRDSDEDEDETEMPQTMSAPLPQQSVRWGFDSARVGEPPAAFSFGRTGSGRLGRWVVRAAPDAPSGPNVLGQEDSDRTDYRFPVAVAALPTFRDLSLSVRCKPVSGHVDQACGLVWRYRDENDYYLARANALEDNVRFYYVQNGRRVQLRGWNGKVASGVWHSLRADMRGDHVEVFFDDQKVIDAHDTRFGELGKVGVWTKADSHTLFDNLTATELAP